MSPGHLLLPQHCLSFLLLFLEVALIIKVTEEDDEGEAVTNHHAVHGVGVVTICEQVVRRVHKNKYKLHLQRRHSSDQSKDSNMLAKACLNISLRRWRRSPAAETSGTVSTTGTSACEGRSQPGHSKSTSQCGQRCLSGQRRMLQETASLKKV